MKCLAVFVFIIFLQCISYSSASSSAQEHSYNYGKSKSNQKSIARSGGDISSYRFRKSIARSGGGISSYRFRASLRGILKVLKPVIKSVDRILARLNDPSILQSIISNLPSIVQTLVKALRSNNHINSAGDLVAEVLTIIINIVAQVLNELQGRLGSSSYSSAASSAVAATSYYANWYSALYGTAGFNKLFGVGTQAALSANINTFIEVLAQLTSIANVGSFTNVGVGLCGQLVVGLDKSVSINIIVQSLIQLQAQFGLKLNAGIISQAITNAAALACSAASSASSSNRACSVAYSPLYQALYGNTGFNTLFGVGTQTILSLNVNIFLTVLAQLTGVVNVGSFTNVGVGLFAPLGVGLDKSSSVNIIVQILIQLQAYFGLNLNAAIISQAISTGAALVSSAASSKVIPSECKAKPPKHAASSATVVSPYSSWYEAIYGNAGFNTIFGVGTQTILSLNVNVFLTVLAQLTGVVNVGSFTNVGVGLFAQLGVDLDKSSSVNQIVQILIRLQAYFGLILNADIICHTMSNAAALASLAASTASNSSTSISSAYSSWYKAIYANAGFNTLFGVGTQAELSANIIAFLSVLAQLTGVASIGSFTNVGVSLFDQLGIGLEKSVSVNIIVQILIQLEAQFGISLTASIISQAISAAAYVSQSVNSYSLSAASLYNRDLLRRAVKKLLSVLGAEKVRSTSVVTTLFGTVGGKLASRNSAAGFIISALLETIKRVLA